MGAFANFALIPEQGTMPQMEQLMKIPDPSIYLDVDFQAVSTKAEGEVGISFQIRDFFAIAFAAAKPVLKWFLAFKKAKRLREAEQKTEQTKQTTKV